MTLIDDIIDNVEGIIIIFIVIVLGLNYTADYFTLFGDVLLYFVLTVIGVFLTYISAIILYSIALFIYEKAVQLKNYIEFKLYEIKCRIFNKEVTKGFDWIDEENLKD